LDIIIGFVAGFVIVLVGAVTWWRCTKNNRNRYRAIGWTHWGMAQQPLSFVFFLGVMRNSHIIYIYTHAPTHKCTYNPNST
jgi:hypothetical protein